MLLRSATVMGWARSPYATSFNQESMFKKSWRLTFPSPTGYLVFIMTRGWMRRDLPRTPLLSMTRMRRAQGKEAEEPSTSSWSALRSADSIVLTAAPSQSAPLSYRLHPLTATSSLPASESCTLSLANRRRRSYTVAKEGNNSGSGSVPQSDSQTARTHNQDPSPAGMRRENQLVGDKETSTRSNLRRVTARSVRRARTGRRHEPGSGQRQKPTWEQEGPRPRPEPDGDEVAKKIG